MLAAGRRQVHHVPPGLHEGSGNRYAKYRGVPNAGVRPAHHRHALAAAQGRRPALSRRRTSGTASRCGRRARSGAGPAVLRDGAHAGGTRRAGARRREGPFGDHTGLYSRPDDYPVFHLTCVTQCKRPIYLTTVVGAPPMEDYYLGLASERIFLPMIRKTLPEIVDMHFPAEGIFHNLVLVSIDKRYPGHARKIMNAFL